MKTHLLTNQNACTISKLFCNVQWRITFTQVCSLVIAPVPKSFVFKYINFHCMLIYNLLIKQFGILSEQLELLTQLYMKIGFVRMGMFCCWNTRLTSYQIIFINIGKIRLILNFSWKCITTQKLLNQKYCTVVRENSKLFLASLKIIYLQSVNQSDFDPGLFP